jgi:N,N'-diacetyllegionaminate synthase
MMHIEVVAELAQGFEGKPEQARLLMKAAASAGAHAAKYQLVYADELATPDYKYYALFRSLEMSDAVWAGLAAYAQELGTRLYVDIFGARSLALVERIGVTVVKLHGTDIANVGFLHQVARSSVPKVLLGAGGAYPEELAQAVEILAGKEVVILLGFQAYPTPNETNQIARVQLLADRYERLGARVSIGFADHAPPDSPLRYALAATAIGAGARVIEKHLTLGKIMKLEDHESALNPDEFAEFCAVIQGCAAAWGVAADTPDFGMSEAEAGYRKTIRRHVITSRDLPAGARLSPADLVLKRSSADPVITNIESVYGKTLKRALSGNAPVQPADIQ